MSEAAPVAEYVPKFADFSLIDSQIAPWSERWPRPCRMDSVTCAILAARNRSK
jgi:hypothetical protein